MKPVSCQCLLVCCSAVVCWSAVLLYLVQVRPLLLHFQPPALSSQARCRGRWPCQRHLETNHRIECSPLRINRHPFKENPPAPACQGPQAVEIENLSPVPLSLETSFLSVSAGLLLSAGLLYCCLGPQKQRNYHQLLLVFRFMGGRGNRPKT